MTREEYIEIILDHFENPRNRGRLDDASVVMNGGNPGCGDVLTLYVAVDEDSERITGLRFEGEGCTISQAGASLVTEEMVGKMLHEVEEMGYDTIIDMMGRDVVATRLRCATLGLSTLKAAVKKHRGTLLATAAE